MARKAQRYVCQSCGAVTSKWSGRCDSCAEWNTIVEDESTSDQPKALAPKLDARVFTLEALSGEFEDAPRLRTGIAELDRVTGGGLVKGSVILVGGDPGIGKSTLLIQTAAHMAADGIRTVYISGEEAPGQVRLRAQRLGIAQVPVELGAETNVEDIIATIDKGEPPRLVIIDSIQTMWTSAADSAPGTVTQVRASAQALVRYAKRSGAAIVLVGHVTKDGQIAGPRVVEHLVDAVLYFEGDGGHAFRILRTVKNRFGPTDEIGVFEMTGDGLKEVSNPSALFLGDRNPETTGSAVFAGVEGTRPVLVEIQALVAPSPLGTPRRAVVGWDSARLSMLLAVLEAQSGLRFSGHDVYLNVAGGFRLSEPAGDLAAAAALISSLVQVPLSVDRVFFGEIALSGAVRPAGFAPLRLKEAEKLGFRSATLSASSGLEGDIPSLSISRLKILNELVASLAEASVALRQSETE